MSKRSLTDEAKQLISTDPLKARDTYVEVWNTFQPEFNDWDAFFLFQAIRKSGQGLEELEKEIFEKFGTNDRVKGIYSWVLFDRYVRNFDETKITTLEPGILRLTEITAQKDMVNATDSFPCPYTIGVNRVIKAYKKPNFNIQKIAFWLDKLDETKLSRVPTKRHDDVKDVDVEMASDYESYLSTKAKFLERTEDYEKCIAVCDKALAEITNMHHDNNIWFVRLKALSLISLDRSEEGEALLESLLKDRKGQKWFIKMELAEVYNDHAQYEKALSYTIDAALTGQDFELKTELFLLIARIFFRTGKEEESLAHAKLLLSITQKEERRIKGDHSNIYNHFKLDTSIILDFNECLKNCKLIWEAEKFSGMQKEGGHIAVLHSNGKSGIINASNGSKRFFSLRELTNKKRSDDNLLNYNVEYFLKDAIDKNGNKDLHAVSIKITERPKNDSATKIDHEMKVGQVFDGVIDNIADFGLFVKFKGTKGLLHRSNLPVKRDSNLSDQYSKGSTIKVKIKAITAKGIDLLIQ